MRLFAQVVMLLIGLNYGEGNAPLMFSVMLAISMMMISYLYEKCP